MEQFVRCNSCGNQVCIPETEATEPISRLFPCEQCGQEVFWGNGLTESPGQLVVFSLDDTTRPVPVQDIKMDDTSLNRPTEPLDSEDSFLFDFDPNHQGAEPNREHFELELEESDASDSQQIGEESIGYGISQSGDDREVFLEAETSDPVGQSEDSSEIDLSVLGTITPRKRPKEVSAIRKILPPILGGLAAFPIATGIMWYGFGRDIGTTGPTVAQYVPWIVPLKLRNEPWSDSPPSSRGKVSLQSTRNLSKDTDSSGSSGQRSLPRLDTGESRMDSPTNFGNVPVSQPVAPRTAPSSGQSSIEETAIPTISETLAKLRKMQNEWETWENASRQDKEKVLAEYYSENCKLSKLASELKGRSALVWQKELESIAREILSHPRIPKAIKWCSEGKLPAIGEAKPNDFIATIIELTETDQPSSSESRTLIQTHTNGDLLIPIEISPLAWRAGAVKKPKICLALGRLSMKDPQASAILSESNGQNVVFRVHSLLPE